MPRGSVMVGTRTRPIRLVVARQGFQELDPCLAERLRVSHDVGLADLDEVGGVEHAADLQLQFQRCAPRFAEFSAEHGLLFVGQVHRDSLRGPSARKHSRLACRGPISGRRKGSIEHGLDPGRHRESQIATGDDRVTSAVQGDQFGLTPLGRGVHRFRVAQCVQAPTRLIHTRGHTRGRRRDPRAPPDHWPDRTIAAGRRRSGRTCTPRPGP